MVLTRLRGTGIISLQYPRKNAWRKVFPMDLKIALEQLSTVVVWENRLPLTAPNGEDIMSHGKERLNLNT